MDLLFRYHTSKSLKRENSNSVCEIQLYEYDKLIHYIADFGFDYLRNGSKHKLSVHHGFTVNLKNGDVNTYYQIVNHSISDGKISRSKNNRKKNDFKCLYNLLTQGLIRGERRSKFWGKKYENAVNSITDILIEKIGPEINLTHLTDKNYKSDFSILPIYDLFVDFHLSKKNIKPHDSIYHTIFNSYPKIKFFKPNENKFLPALLDSYGIKSKYLIGELNKPINREVNVKTLNFLCKLFGDEYIDYLKQVDWTRFAKTEYNFKKCGTLKNKNEKNSLIKVLNDSKSIQSENDSFPYDTIIKFLTIREFLESKGIHVKLNATNLESLELLLKTCENLKNYYKKGYKIRYVFPENFLNDIESDIIIDKKKFKVRVLKTEEDFITEGFLMKNCLGKQFNKGVIYIYLVMEHNKTKIDLEYKKGCLTMSFGKANSPVESYFTTSITEISKKMMRYSNMVWSKEKYEYILK